MNILYGKEAYDAVYMGMRLYPEHIYFTEVAQYDTCIMAIVI